MPSYFPSAKVRLRVRFEELGQPTSLVLPSVPQGERRTGQDPAPQVLRYTPLAGTTEPGQAAVEGFLLEAMTTAESRGTIAEGSASDDGLTWVVGSILPKHVVVERNGVRQADTFKVEIPWQDFPFDPRLVRSIGVEIYVGVVSGEDYDRGIGGEVRVETGEPYSLVPDWDDERGGRSNRRLIGFVDHVGGDHGDGQSSVMMEGRDLTCILIDSNLPPNVQADLTKPLSEIFAQVLATLPAAEGLTVKVLPAGTTTPPLAVPSSAPRHQRRRRGRQPQRPAKGKQSKVSYWDYLTDLAGVAGFVCFVDGTDVVLQQPRTIYGSRFPRRDGDAFEPRIVDGEILQVRRMVWGRNVEKLGYERKYAKIKVNTVEVRCYDPEARTTLIGRFPEDPRLTEAPPGQSGGDEKIDVFRVSGIRDPERLKVIAQSIYELQGRGEMGFTLETRDLHSYASDDQYNNTFPDLLDLRSGDPVQIRVDRQPDFESDQGHTDTVTSLQADDESQRASYLESLGFSRELAQKYAELWEAAAHQDVFRTKDSSIEWDASDGATIKVGLINYIEVRAEALLSVGEPVAPTPEAAGTTAPSDTSENPSRVRSESVLDENPDPLYPLNLEGEL